MRKLENTTKTTAIYSDDNKHRYVLSKEWDNGGKKAMLVMLYPCAVDLTQLDLTTMLCCNNLVKLDFSCVHILNLYSKVNANLTHNVTEINTTDIAVQIEKGLKLMTNYAEINNKQMK